MCGPSQFLFHWIGLVSLFLCMPYRFFVVENWAFHYYSTVILDITFSSIPSVYQLLLTAERCCSFAFETSPRYFYKDYPLCVITETSVPIISCSAVLRFPWMPVLFAFQLCAKALLQLLARPASILGIRPRWTPKALLNLFWACFACAFIWHSISSPGYNCFWMPSFSKISPQLLL